MSDEGTSSFESQLRDPLYTNWVKAGLAPKYLKEVLACLVDDGIKSLQTQFFDDICNTLSLDTASCSDCTTANIIACPTEGFCKITRHGKRFTCSYHVKGDTLKEHRKCPNDICNRIYKKIIDNHRHNRPSWRNTDARQWCSNHWEIGKCFLPTVGGYDDVTSVAQMDCSGILNIAINCLSIQKDLDVCVDPPEDVLSQVIKARNEVVHSASMTLTQDDLHGYIDMMLTLLQDRKKMATYPTAQEAVDKLTQLKDGKFIISTKVEEDILELYHKKRKQDYDGRMKKLQSALCCMYEKQFSTIQVSPLLEDVEAAIDDVVVDLIISEPKVLGSVSNDHQAGKMVEGYRDIFYKDDAKCTHMYVIGDAGMGKTTWCRKMLNTWVSGCRKLSSGTSTTTAAANTTALSDDELVMVEFDIVLFVSLRHAESERNIRDMIRNQLFQEQPRLDEYLTTTLEKAASKCLVILDGLDEWFPADGPAPGSSLQHPGLPGRKDLYSCPVLTTTRPWKLDSTRLLHKDIDKAVQIQGLRDYRVLAKKIIENKREIMSVNGQKPSELTFCKFETDLYAAFKLGEKRRLYCPKYTKFEKNLKLNKVRFLEVPLILLYMVCLWCDIGRLETTWAGNFSGILECLILAAEGNKGRLHTVKGLSKLTKKWSRSYNYLPSLLCTRKVCKKYSYLIIKIGHFAFKSLFDSENMNKLVFSQTEIEQAFSKKELDVAVKIGILSQSKVVGKSLSNSTSLSFLHKTLQEYMAALYICSNALKESKPLEILKGYLNSKITGIHIQSLLFFVYGINPWIGNEISKHMATIAVGVEWDIAFKIHWYTSAYSRIEFFNIHDLALESQSVFEETCKSYQIYKLCITAEHGQNTIEVKIQKTLLRYFPNKDHNTGDFITEPIEIEDCTEAMNWLSHAGAEMKAKGELKVTKLFYNKHERSCINLSFCQNVNKVTLIGLVSDTCIINYTALELLAMESCATSCIKLVSGNIETKLKSTKTILEKKACTAIQVDTATGSVKLKDKDDSIELETLPIFEDD